MIVHALGNYSTRGPHCVQASDGGLSDVYMGVALAPRARGGWTADTN